MRERLDKLLVDRGLVPSRERARAVILAGQVLVNDRPATKAGTSVAADAEIRLRTPDHPYVSRGGVKLAGALDRFGIDPAGHVCADVGASTGGFTDVLLRRGARQVYAIDVGYGLLDSRLRADSRVTVIERTNIRHWNAATAPISEPVTLATIDVSFISLRLVLPVVHQVVEPQGVVVALVKPQFEVGRGGAKKGVVRDEALRQAAIDGIAEFAQQAGFAVLGGCDSPIAGPKGNLEAFLYLRRCKST